MEKLFLKSITESTKDFDEKTGLWLFYSLEKPQVDIEKENVIADIMIQEFDKGTLVRECTIPLWALKKINLIYSDSINRAIV